MKITFNLIAEDVKHKTYRKRYKNSQVAVSTFTGLPKPPKRQLQSYATMQCLIEIESPLGGSTVYCGAAYCSTLDRYDHAVALRESFERAVEQLPTPTSRGALWEMFFQQTGLRGLRQVKIAEAHHLNKGFGFGPIMCSPETTRAIINGVKRLATGPMAPRPR